jgi:hypothetical protein
MKKINSTLQSCLAALLFLLVTGATSRSQTLPYTFNNKSTLGDNALYMAVVGIINDEHVWVDCKTSTVYPMSASYNTVSGPVNGGDMGPGGNGKYAGCFTKLSDIPNKTVNIPKIAGCRILISFNQQLYLYFFGASGAPSGYAAPNLQNPNDPNQGIRFELIELSYVDNGLWTNTSRVDAYQYPMGLEVWGNNGFYKQVGEVKSHDQIIAQWQSSAPSDFQGCLDAATGVIKFPTKTGTFNSTYFQSYIDAIWSKYASADLVFNAGDAGTWKGHVQGEQFIFNRTSDGQVATITSRPSTVEAMEGSGVLAYGGQWDKVVQAQFCAAINRHALDLNIASGVTQDWSDASKYYQTSPYNWYAKFWHSSDISYNQLSYAFCYDDVFDKSSTINAPSPTKAVVTIGGFVGATTGKATFYKDCNYGGYAIGLNEGNYTMSQLIANGISDDDISSLKVSSGYKVIFYRDDNFGGSSLTKTADDDCLVDDGWNDQVTSLSVQSANTALAFIEAENYISMSGVQTESCTEGTLDVGYIEAGDWMLYNNITFPVTGTYTIQYRVASTSGATLSSDLSSGTIPLGNVTIPATGGWQNWTTVAQTVTITAGTYPFGIYAQTGGWNINWFGISQGLKSAKVNNQATPTFTTARVNIYPNPIKNKTMHIGLSGLNTNESAMLIIYDLNGKQVLQTKILSSAEVDLNGLSAGAYIVKIETGETCINKNIVVL